MWINSEDGDKVDRSVKNTRNYCESTWCPTFHLGIVGPGECGTCVNRRQRTSTPVMPLVSKKIAV